MSHPPETPEAKVTSPSDSASQPNLVAADDIDWAVATWTHTALVEVATGIVMGRRDCTLDEALALLSDAAKGHDIDVSDLARCVLAEEELR